MNLSCANSAILGAAGAVIGYDFVGSKRFTTRSAAQKWADSVSGPRSVLWGRCYLIVTDKVVKIGSSSNFRDRFEALFARGPLSYYPLHYIVLSPLRVDYQSLERQCKRLCATVGVPRYGGLAQPYGLEYFNSGHPLFEKLGAYLEGELQWDELIALLVGNSDEAKAWRASVLANDGRWFAFRKHSTFMSPPPPSALRPQPSKQDPVPA